MFKSKQQNNTKMESKTNPRGKILVIIHNHFLRSAIKSNNLSRVKELVENGANVNYQGRNMSTPLHVAAQYGRHMIVQFLIKNGACIDATLSNGKNSGFTPLYFAVQKNDLKCVTILLQKGASVSSKIEGVCHPIHFAVANNNLKIVELLLRYGADANQRFSNKFFECYLDAMISKIVVDHDNYEQFNVQLYHNLWHNHDLPLIHYAVLSRFQEMATILHEHGADVNVKTNLGRSLLMQAVEVNDVDWVKILIKPENVNDRDVFGQPVLHFLLLNERRKESMYSIEDLLYLKEKHEIFQYLLEEGVDVNVRFPEDDKRGSIIHYMIKFGFFYGVRNMFFICTDLNFSEIDLTSLYSAQILNENLLTGTAMNANELRYFQMQFEDIIYSIIYKAMSLQAMGVPIDQNLILKEPIFDWMSKDQLTRIINGYAEKISGLVNYMKQRKIGESRVTFWDIVTCQTDKVMKLVTNKDLNSYRFSDDTEGAKMDIFAATFLKRITDAKMKRAFVKKFTGFMAHLLIHKLPYDCCEEIVSYLNVRDIIWPERLF